VSPVPWRCPAVSVWPSSCCVAAAGARRALEGLGTGASGWYAVGVDLLSREDIVGALDALADELAGEPAPLELVLVGGAAIVLLYGARESTRDVDAVFMTSADMPRVRAAVARVAALRGLPGDWLNDAAKGYVVRLAHGPSLLERPKLIVRAAAIEQLLAMKLCAWRDDADIADARLLLEHLAGDRLAIWARVETHLVPGRELKARYAFDDLWETRDGAG
jgi:hypothetical protein